jgi:hypothetical protein
MHKARMAFVTLHMILNSRACSIGTGTKLPLFNPNVKSVLLYGCETWKDSKTIIKLLQVFINNYLRRILCTLWPVQISNNDLCTRTNQIRIDLKIQLWKWGWLGHTLRKPPNEIARLALDWNPQGSRGRDRPNVAWRSTVLKEAKIVGKPWKEFKNPTRSRVRWENLVEALCSEMEWFDYIYIYIYIYIYMP